MEYRSSSIAVGEGVEIRPAYDQRTAEDGWTYCAGTVDGIVGDDVRVELLDGRCVYVNVRRVKPCRL